MPASVAYHPAWPAPQRPLLATEHTEFDAGAERVALALARHHGLPLHVLLPLASNAEFEMLAPQLAQRADAQARAALSELQREADAQGVSLQAEVRRGPELDQAIVACAQAMRADLMVVRRRGRRGFLSRLLVGEMVSRLVAHADCSVLLVPRPGQLWQRAVLVALDPTAPAAPQAVCVAQAMAQAAAAAVPLHLVAAHAKAGGDAAQALLEALSPRELPAGVTVQRHLRQGVAHEQVLEVARAVGADLIVVGRHSLHLPSAKAWIGGTAQKVIGLADVPVLVAIGAPRDRAAPDLNDPPPPT
jgi:nucleotide-binding universal stress UspA family protein